MLNDAKVLGPPGDHCSSCPAFTNGICGYVSKSDQQAISENSVRYLLRSNSVILDQGEDCGRIGVVVSGYAKMVYYPESGDQQLIHILKPGDLVGDPNFSKNAVSTEAATDMIICSAPRAALTRLLNERPHLLWVYFGHLTKQTEAEHVWQAELRWRSTVERLAFWLSYQVRIAMGATKPTINIKLTRQDLASYLNMSTETLCRGLRTLENTGVIKMHAPSQIGVDDTMKLANVARQSQEMQERL